MGKNTVLGTILIGVVLWLGVFESAKNIALFFNFHALILVIGGTVAVTVATYPLSKIFDLIIFLVFGFWFKRGKTNAKTVEDLINRVREFLNPPHVIQLHDQVHPFLMEAAHFLVDESVNVKQMETILKARRDAFRRRYFEDARILVKISKFPPALGLLGASAGMIEMMAGLGSGTENIGMAMAVALTSTFWGIGIANFVLLPLADYAERLALDDVYIRDVIIEGIVFARKGFPERVVIDHLISKLPISERVALIQKVGFYPRSKDKDKEKTDAA